MTTDPRHRRAAAPASVQIATLNRLQSGLTRVLVTVAVVALAFTATNVTLFAVRHHVSEWIAWLLDPMVAVALGAVLIVDGRLSEYGIRPSGWASALRWFAGLGTWVMNCWSSLWPAGSAFGIPRQVDPAGLVLHSIPPVLLIILAEAITHYRRAILGAITDLRAQVDTEVDAVEPPVAAPAVHPAATPAAAAPLPAPATVVRPPAEPAPEPSPLVICGGGRLFPLTVPQASAPQGAAEQETEKLPADEALNVIRTCWVDRETITEAARRSTRSTSYVHKVYKRLAEQAETEGRTLALVPSAGG